MSDPRAASRPDFPGTLLFGCICAPEEGGATTVGDMREAFALIPPALRERFERTGWPLVRNFSELAGLPWQKASAPTTGRRSRSTAGAT